MTRVIEIWWGWELRTLLMSRIKWWALVSDAVTTLNLMWLECVVQSNERFDLSDRLEVHLDHVRMRGFNVREKTKGRFLDVSSAIKKSIVVVKAAFFCLAHA